MPQTLDYILHRAVAEIISETSLRKRLESGRPLRLKMGFDPSRPYLHIGHAIGIRKMRRLQELGHTVVLIVGDWTAQIGDPSGKDESRPVLTALQVQENAKTYMDQFFKIVDRDKTEVRYQTEWFGDFSMTDVLHLTRQFTLADMMEHETFEKRFKGGQPLTLTELLYPLLQAYDSIAVTADVEFGGMDQKFNILQGRKLQERYGQTPQEVFLVPLLLAPDGGRQMSKSLGNTIELLAMPNEMFGKVMSIADSVMMQYYDLTTEVPEDEIKEMQREWERGAVNPRDLKLRLARNIVEQFHGAHAAQAAEQEFLRVFSKRELPAEMGTYTLQSTLPLVDLLVAVGFAPSKSEARRLVLQGGVRLDEEKIDKIETVIEPRDAVLSVGRRKFIRLARPDGGK